MIKVDILLLMVEKKLLLPRNVWLFALLRLKDSAGVVTAYNDLITLQPSNAMNYLYLGLAAADAGQTHGALLAFGRFLQLSPNSQYAAQVKQRMAQLEAQLKTPTPVPTPVATSTTKATATPVPSPSPSK